MYSVDELLGVIRQYHPDIVREAEGFIEIQELRRRIKGLDARMKEDIREIEERYREESKPMIERLTLLEQGKQVKLPFTDVDKQDLCEAGLGEVSVHTSEGPVSIGTIDDLAQTVSDAVIDRLPKGARVNNRVLRDGYWYRRYTSNGYKKIMERLDIPLRIDGDGYLLTDREYSRVYDMSTKKKEN